MQTTSHTTKEAIKRLKLDPKHPSLTERGFTQETIQTFGLGFCSTGAMAGRIVIPIHNHGGNLIAYAGYLPQGGMPECKLSAGFDPSLEFFNLNRAALESTDKVLIVVEGFFDAIKLHQLGHHKVVALMGNRLSPTQENILMRANRHPAHLSPSSTGAGLPPNRNSNHSPSSTTQATSSGSPPTAFRPS